MSTPVISPYTFADLRTPKDQTVNKQAILQALVDHGHDQVLSYAPEAVPSMHLETEADAITNFQFAQKTIVEGGYNDWATGDALLEHSRQTYDNDPLEGAQTIGSIELTDTGAGPFQITPSSISVSIGIGGLLFEGIDDPTGAVTSPVTLPRNGTCRIFVRAVEVGAKYNAVTGTIDTMARGGLPGVTVNNPSDWLTVTGAVQGADEENPERLRARNPQKWGTLGTGSPQSAYVSWALAASASVTRVRPHTNLDMLDPGTVTLIIAGDAGGVGGSVVQAVQDYIAPAQVGGSRIPEGARCVVASAANNTIAIEATLYVPGELNTSAFLAEIAANVLAFQKAHEIGGKVSWERVMQVVLQVASTDPTKIADVDWVSPVADQQLLYNEVPVFDLSGLTLVSV